MSEWVIDSFRFGDSYRISELCELVDLYLYLCVFLWRCIIHRVWWMPPSLSVYISWPCQSSDIYLIITSSLQYSFPILITSNQTTITRHVQRICKPAFNKNMFLGVLQREWCEQAGSWVYSLTKWDYLRLWSGSETFEIRSDFYLIFDISSPNFHNMWPKSSIQIGTHFLSKSNFSVVVEPNIWSYSKTANWLRK